MALTNLSKALSFWLEHSSTVAIARLCVYVYVVCKVQYVW